MPNIIGYKDLSNLYIKPAAEPTRTISDIDLKSASEPERVLNPIVSESYMRQYIEEHGGITPSGNIEITENTVEGESLDVSQYATATVTVDGGGDDFPKLTLNITNSSESEEDISVIGTAINNMAGLILSSDMFAYYDASFPIAIAKGETVTVTIYYSYDAYISDNTGALVMLNNDASVTTTATSNTNMTFDNEHGGWYVTDSTIDSELNITCLVGR